MLKKTKFVQTNKELEKEFELFQEADFAYNDGKYKKAFKLFLKAAKNNDDGAMGRLACMYLDGEGTKPNLKKSIFWDMKAIEAGNLSSIFNIAISYKLNNDFTKARHWFEKALEAGNVEATIELAKLHMRKKNDVKKVQYYLSKALKCKELDEDLVVEAKALLSKISEQ